MKTTTSTSQRGGSNRLGGTLLLYALAIFWLLVAGLPFYFMVQSGFKAQFDLLTAPFWTLPTRWVFENYLTVLSGPFVRSLLNSVIVVSVSVALVLLVGSMASFVFARTHFRLNRPLFVLIVAGLVIPVHVTLIPVYILTTNLKLYDSLFALIGPYVAFSLPLAVFILTAFMREIPRELEEAARMDGASTALIFWRIILPLSWPGLATVGIYNAVTLWNEFVFAYVLTSSPASRTLPLAIWDYQGQYAANIPLIMAVLSLAAAPLILIYIVAQERVVGGMMAGALKG
ncbi:MAG: carbohydrate ABC transporter permease [Chloroflexota bacterium]|nr:MAG: carbohydrate ABC transporter permease [Chloroflexota bacterium]